MTLVNGQWVDEITGENLSESKKLPPVVGTPTPQSVVAERESRKRNFAVPVNDTMEAALPLTAQSVGSWSFR